MELFKEESQGDILKQSLMIGEDEERAEDSEKLEDYAPDQKIVLKLEEMYKAGKLAQSDLDERAFEALKEFPVEDAVEVLDQFFDSNLEHVSNKSAYLCAIMKAYRQKSRTGVSDTAPVTTSTLQSTPLKGPDEEKIKAIMDRTGYSLDVTFGQRKYGGPPPGWEGKPPISGCEVFCGKIPKDFYEDELIPLFEECGTIWDLRLMMDPMTGTNRGYAFVTFTTREAAQSAVRKLDNHEIKPGVNLRINISVSNLRLFVGNIPKSKDKDEILEEFGKLTAGLTEVIIYSSPDDKKKNRGFCFLEYESHKAASLAKRKLGTGRIKVWGCDIIVDWADPQEEPDEEKMSTVKVLYVRNLTQEITEQKLKEEFEIYGKVERVKKIKDYAFIHFEDRERALRAMESLDSKKMGGANIEVTLAKPPSDKKKKEDILRARERRMMQMIHVRGGLMPGTQPAMRATPRYTESSMRLPGLGRGDYDYDYDFYADNRVCYSEPYYDDFYQYNYYDYQPPTPLVRGRSRQVIDLDEAVFSGVYDFNNGIQIGRGRGVLGRVRSSGPINRSTLTTRSGWMGGAGGRGAPRQASRRGGRTKASLSVMLPVA